MSAGSSRGSGAGLSDLVFFASYVEATSSRSLKDCIFSLRDNQGTSVFFGGYKTSLTLGKSNASQTGVPFEIVYRRLSQRRRNRTSFVVQRMKGALYQEDGKTHLIAKVRFTIPALIWLWVASVLTVISVALLFYSQHIAVFILIGLSG